VANYLARVELHNATYEDYEQLHAAMERRQFHRVIQADDKTWYSLPTGTYNKYSAATVQEALNDAIAAANETGKRHSLIVVSWTAARWDGLPKV